MALAWWAVLCDILLNCLESGGDARRDEDVPAGDQVVLGVLGSGSSGSGACRR